MVVDLRAVSTCSLFCNLSLCGLLVLMCDVFFVVVVGRLYSKIYLYLVGGWRFAASGLSEVAVDVGWVYRLFYSFRTRSASAYDYGLGCYMALWGGVGG